MDHLRERLAAAAVAGALGLIVVLLLPFWIDDLPGWAFVAVPAACAVAGFVAGDQAVEALKQVISWI